MQKTRQKETELERTRKIKIDVGGSVELCCWNQWTPSRSLCLLMQSQQSQCCQAESDWITWGLEKSQITQRLISFADTELWVFVERQRFTSTKTTNCQLGGGRGWGGGGRSRWKMDDKYQDKWRLSQTVLSLTKAERAPDISPRPKLSILITKFTCQRGRKSTREWGRRFVKSGQKNLIKYKNADLGR